MDHSLLLIFIEVFGLAVLVTYGCLRFKIAPVVGFLLTGVLVGPSVLGLVHASHEVELLAEVGVVLLLFTIGLELSISELARLGRSVFLGGGFQVFATIGAVAALAVFVGYGGNKAVFLGMLAALSSTAIVLKVLAERGEAEAPHGRMALSVLIFQDLIVVPMVIITPLLAGGGSLSRDMLTTAGTSLGLLGLALLLAWFVLPRIFLAVARTKSRELFLLTTLVACLAVAFATAELGLSLSLGAFLAGLIVSESEFSLRALEGVLPFRDVFTSLFFISVGMLLDVSFSAAHLPEVLGASLVIFLGKAVLAAIAALLAGAPLRVALISGLVLAQVGEFSFVLAKVGLSSGLIVGSSYQLFLAASILTMTATPTLIALAPRVAAKVLSLPPFRGVRDDVSLEDTGPAQDHLVIVGFGPGGRQLAQAAREAEIPYRIVEMNPDTVRRAREAGEPILLGDASTEPVLEHVRAQAAQAMAVLVPDPVVTRRVVDAARHVNPRLHIVARTRYSGEIGSLAALGADDVVSEEFEGALEVFTRVLAHYLVPRDDIETIAESVRSVALKELNAEDDGPQRPGSAVSCPSALSLRFAGMELAGLTVSEGSRVAHLCLAESELRTRTGVTVMGVRRSPGAEGGEEEHILNPAASFVLEPGDVAYVVADREALARAQTYFSPRGAGSPVNTTDTTAKQPSEQSP